MYNTSWSCFTEGHVFNGSIDWVLFILLFGLFCHVMAGVIESLRNPPSTVTTAKTELEEETEKSEQLEELQTAEIC